MTPARFGQWRVSFPFRKCGAPHIYLDGLLLHGWALDDVMDIENVGAVEVYVGWSTIPAQFMSVGACAVVVVWTR